MVLHERLLRKLDEARLIATRRSGARGLKARKLLIATEEEVKISEERLNEDLSTIEASVLSEDTKLAAETLADVQTSLEMVSISVFDICSYIDSSARWIHQKQRTERERSF
jgi:ATP-binding cassette subfamily F protein 3